MTALGKTMVIFVFLLSLVWAGLVVNTWATRTNWKAEADKQSKVAKDNYDGAKAITEQSKADRSASDAKLAALQANVDRLQGQLVEQREQYNKLYAAYDEKLKQDRVSAGKVDDLNTELKKVLIQVDYQTTALKVMEKDLNAQVRETEKNKNLREEADRSALAEKQRAEELRTRLGQKEEEIAAARSGDKGNRPLAPENFRGTVTAYSGGFVALTPGLNSGLKPGTQLTIRRVVGSKNFIGTVTVGDQIDPDKAVGTWTPPAGVKKPTGDDFPKAGDELIPR